MSDIKEAKKTCKNVTISSHTRNRKKNSLDGLKQIEGLDIDFSGIKMNPEQWIRILEQVCNEIYVSSNIEQ